MCGYRILGGVRLRSHQPSARLERHGDRVPAGLWARILQRLLALNAAIWFNWQISSGLSWRILSVPRGESLNPVGNGVARRDARKAPQHSQAAAFTHGVLGQRPAGTARRRRAMAARRPRARPAPWARWAGPGCAPGAGGPGRPG
jgi:hypothetical protein